MKRFLGSIIEACPTVTSMQNHSDTALATRKRASGDTVEERQLAPILYVAPEPLLVIAIALGVAALVISIKDDIPVRGRFMYSRSPL